MQPNRTLLLLLTVVTLVAACGAGCPRVVRQYAAPAPRVLPPSPTLEQVIEVVNRNSMQIQSFSTNGARITGPGFPTLRANVAWARPRRFRLKAETGLTSTELDIGSNEELFWFWVRRNQPPAVYYCRHSQFATSGVREMIPIEPDWLVEALGICEFDPTLPHQGPFPLPDGRLEIRTVRETAAGPSTKVTIIDAARGWVLARSIYDAQGQLKASAVASRHRRDPLSGLTLPGTVDIQCPASQFAMRIDLGNVRINSLGVSASPELWTMPGYSGYPAVDLCDPNRQFAPTPSATALPPAVSLRRSRNRLMY